MSAYWKRFSILAFLSLLVSGYLLFHFTEVSRGFQEEKSFCSISASVDCDAIAKSGYSVLFGLPVAGWAIIYYLVFLVLVAFVTKEGEDESRAANILLFYISLALVPTIALLAVSHFVIQKYCLMCLTLDVANLLLFVVAFRCPARRDPFLTSLGSGMTELLRLIPSVQGAILGVVAAVSACTVYLAPEALVRHYFVPRRQSHNDVRYLQPLLDDWARAPLETVAFNRTGSATEKDFGLGDPDAPVTIIEFSDFECPYCKRTAEYLKPFIINRPKDFQFIFKNYPLDQSCNHAMKTAKHEFACRAALMARCAGAESDEKFWKMHDALMDTSLFSDGILEGLVNESGVYRGPFDACMKEPAVAEKLRADIDLGNAIKVLSTPTILVNGRRIQVSPQLLPGLLELILKQVNAQR